MNTIICPECHTAQHVDPKVLKQCIGIVKEKGKPAEPCKITFGPK